MDILIEKLLLSKDGLRQTGAINILVTAHGGVIGVFVIACTFSASKFASLLECWIK